MRTPPSLTPSAVNEYTRKLFFITLLILTIFLGSFAVIVHAFLHIRSFIQNDVPANVAVIEENSELSRRLVAIESLINTDSPPLPEAPGDMKSSRMNILAALEELQTEWPDGPGATDPAGFQPLVSDYRRKLDNDIRNSTRLYETMEQLNGLHQQLDARLKEMEDATGQLLVDYTLAGKNATGLKQIFALLPFCREQALLARLNLNRSISDHNPGLLGTGGERPDNHHTVTGAINSLRHTLGTFTAASREVADNATALLESSSRYLDLVRELHTIMLSRRASARDLDHSRQALLSYLASLDQRTAKTLTSLKNTNSALLTNSSLIIVIVVTFVLIITLAGWLLIARIRREMLAATAQALRSTEMLETRNQQLLQEKIDREEAENRQSELEKQLQQAHKMEAIGTLAGGIAHDFNNILAIILGYTDLSLLKLAPDSPVKSDLEKVRKAGDRARELVKQILTFSRQNERELAPIQLQSITKETIKLLSASLPSTIEIRQEIDPRCDSFWILADQVQMHQILMNLCTNASHAMQGRGGVLTVALTVVAAGEEGAGPADLPALATLLRLRVSDTGCGMDPAVREKIFEPYFTTKEHGKGTGMGLAVVHGIIKSHGGHIMVDSVPGAGTTVSVYFPVIEEKGPAQPSVDTTTLPRGRGERILLVDDEEFVTQVHQEMLTNLNYQITGFTSSVDAFEEFKAHPDEYHLVITDMTMPRMTGDELGRKIKEIRPDIPVILCTGYSEVISEERVQALGFEKFIMKPFVLRKIAAAIRTILDAGPGGRK